MTTKVIDAFIADQGIDTTKRGWRTSLPKPPTASFEDGETLYIGTFANELVALDTSNGTVIWRYPTAGWAWASPILEGDTLYFSDIAGNFYAIDRNTQEALWSIQTESDIVGAPLLTEDGIYFTNEVRMDAEEKFLYAAETMGNRVLRYPVTADGLGEAEVFGPGQFDPGGYPDGITFDAEGNLWITHIIRNGLGVITPDGDYHVVFEDVTQPALANAVSLVEQNALTPEAMYACMGATIQFPASITFAGPDLKTAYLGSLAMPHLVKFQSPVAGLPMRHWA